MPKRCDRGPFNWSRWLLPSEQQEMFAIATVERAICDQLAELQKRRQRLSNLARCRERASRVHPKRVTQSVMGAE